MKQIETKLHFAQSATWETPQHSSIVDNCLDAMCRQTHYFGGIFVWYCWPDSIIWNEFASLVRASFNKQSYANNWFAFEVQDGTHHNKLILDETVNSIRTARTKHASLEGQRKCIIDASSKSEFGPGSPPKKCLYHTSAVWATIL